MRHPIVCYMWILSNGPDSRASTGIGIGIPQNMFLRRPASVLIKAQQC